jgi:8-oxo-dGTP diphosphatase
MSHTYEYPRPSVTVDCVVFGVADHLKEMHVLLIRRGSDPFQGLWALPGGFVETSDTGNQGESLDEAAQRELSEETGAQVGFLEQLGTYGTPGRDPRGRVISVAYYALVRLEDHPVKGGDDAAEAKWWPIEKALQMYKAFDHDKILKDAWARLQAKVRYAPIGFNLLPPKFSLTELQSLYELILNRTLDKRNFRKRILAMGILKEAGVQVGVPHRRATLYRFDSVAYERAVREGFNFEI